MKKSIVLLISAFFVASFCFADIEGERFQQSQDAVQGGINGHIDSKGLSALIAADIPFILLDARGNKWHDNSIIPGARMASYETSAEELGTLIPNTNCLIIVYCYSFTCPLGRMLVKNLIKLGYFNVIEYPGGLSEWRDVANYPVDTIAQSAIFLQ